MHINSYFIKILLTIIKYSFFKFVSYKKALETDEKFIFYQNIIQYYKMFISNLFLLEKH